MPVRVGFLSAAHMHLFGYAAAFGAHPDAEVVGLWDDDASRGQQFASKTGVPFVASLMRLLDTVDAVVITSENRKHAELGEAAAGRGKDILCEKPLVTTEEEGQRLLGSVGAAGVKLMTAFPCRFSPAFGRLKERVKNGDIGPLKAICATNRGRCPFDWFVEKDLSGGGAMIDHVVHVADLLRDLVGEDPVRVQAQTGNNIYGQEWEDTAMLTLEYAGGLFATLDSSWSRPPSYKTWGDVTMTLTGEGGLIEMDMFGPAVDLYRSDSPNHMALGYGSDLDAAVVNAFVRCVLDDTEPPITGHDGMQAARVAMAGYRSAAVGQSVGFGE